MAEPCGCRMLRAAGRASDPRARAVLVREARAAQEAWQCPARAGDHDHARPADPAGLSGRCRMTLADVEGLLDVQREPGDPPVFATCPEWYAMHPWTHDASTAYRWWEKGQLHALYPHPPAVLVDAIEEIAGAVDAASAETLRRAQAERGRDG